MKITTKTDLLTQLAMVRRYCETIDNPMTRSEAAGAVGAVSNAIDELIPDATFSHEQLQADYASVREFIIDERGQRIKMQRKYPDRSDYWRGRVQATNSTGIALGRMAQSLGLQVPSVVANAEPEPQQAALISVPGREVMA